MLFIGCNIIKLDHYAQDSRGIRINDTVYVRYCEFRHFSM